MSDLPKPDYARNVRIISHTDQGGRPDGVQLMVHRGFAYIGHMFSKGFSILDLHDVSKPRPVNYIPAPQTPGIFISRGVAHRNPFRKSVDERD